MIFGKRKIKDKKSVNIISYPDKLVIESKYLTKHGSWITSDNVTILDIDTPDNILVDTLLNYLGLSCKRDFSPVDFKSLRKAYLKKTKFKSEKAAMENARMVGVFMTNDKRLRFAPKENRFSDGLKRAYYGIPDKISYCKLNDSVGDIAKNIRLGIDNCKIT